MSIQPSPWHYFAHVDRVIDGDTLDLTVDTGFRSRRVERIRLTKVDTHETYGVSKDSEEYQKGQRETEFVVEWLKEAERRTDNLDHMVVVETTQEQGSFNRYLAEIYRWDDSGEEIEEKSLNEQLIDTFGDDVKYDG